MGCCMLPRKAQFRSTSRHRRDSVGYRTAEKAWTTSTAETWAREPRWFATRSQRYGRLTVGTFTYEAGLNRQLQFVESHFRASAAARLKRIAPIPIRRRVRSRRKETPLLKRSGERRRSCYPVIEPWSDRCCCTKSTGCGTA